MYCEKKNNQANMEFWRSLSLILISFPIMTKAQATWDYGDGANGPASWYKNYPKCNGSLALQSPIDYKTSDIIYGQSLGAITLDYEQEKNHTVSVLFNTGHTLDVHHYNAHAYNISGLGRLGSKFKFVKISFHWGSSNSEGSEHHVNGKTYPAEMHLLHYNTKYKDLNEAMNKTDGLAVLAVFLQVDANDNDAFKPIFDPIPGIVNKGMTKLVWQFDLRKLLPANIDDFYRNNGSLTTPGCNEVTWTVFRNVVYISHKQLNLLRSLKKDSSEPIGKNFRPIQSTNGRKIYASFPNGTQTAFTAGPSAGPTAVPTTSNVGGTQALGTALLTVIICALISLVQ